MADAPEGIRLQAYLSHCGVASRRASEALILAGRVSVNGEVVARLGTRVGEGDRVTLDGRELRPEGRKIVLALNKPPLYLCSSSDPQGRPLALDLLSAYPERLYNVGRLDYRSSGLIFFTNDGNFAEAVAHPSAGIEKEYLVDSSVPVPERFLEDFRAGTEVDGVLYRCSEIERLGRASLRIVLVEGKNREIRRMFSAYRLHPTSLRRVRIGPVLLGGLPEGAHRPLEEREIRALRELAGRN